MNPYVLALRMRELAEILESYEEDGVESLTLEVERFGKLRATVDPTSTAPAASFNRNRIYLCGTDERLTKDALRELISIFEARGVPRFFAWLSPGTDLDSVKSWLAALSFSRVIWTRYPTMIHGGGVPPSVPTPFIIRSAGPDELALAKVAMGDVIMEGYVRTIGKPDFFHYVAFDAQQPVAVAALVRYRDIGYLTYASTRPEDRHRGAHRALIAHRIAHAQKLGCRHVTTQTLTMLETSWSNLQKSGFCEVYDQEVYEYAFS